MVSTWLIPATRPTEPEMSTHTKQRIVPAVWCGGDAPQEDQFKYADRRYQQKEIKEEEDDDEDESRPPTHPLPTHSCSPDVHVALHRERGTCSVVVPSTFR